MPDITMCRDNECSRFAKCYRAQATPNPYRQSYFLNSPRKGSECDYFQEGYCDQMTRWSFCHQLDSFRKTVPEMRKGQSLFNFAEDCFGQKFQNETFKRSGSLDPFYKDAHIDAFMKHLVDTGCLVG